MRQLNRRVELEQIDEATVAAEFLRVKLDIETSVETLSRAQRIGKHLREHLQLVRRSLLPAILLAVPLGVLAWRLPVLGQLLLAIAGVIQTIPALALLVLLMPMASWLGFASVGENSLTAVAALFLYSLLPIARNTVVGLQNVPESLRDSADALGFNRFWRLHYVELPLATRTILAGIKTATVLNIGYATLGALIGAGGLGQPILTGIRLNRFGLILDGAIPAALLALVAQAFFEILERYAISRGLR
jgi:osmoprotectant transport system permease protein